MSKKHYSTIGLQKQAGSGFKALNLSVYYIQ